MGPAVTCLLPMRIRRCLGWIEEFVPRSLRQTTCLFEADGIVTNHRDQASVLKQIGLLKDPALPVFGVETARKVVDPKFDYRASRGT